MRMERRRALPALVILLLATAPLPSLPQAIAPTMASALPVEAPASIFDAKLGNGPDDDAQLSIAGSWSASLLSSLDLQAPNGGSLSLGSAQPLLFTQDPNLFLSFLLYKKVFVEARVADDVTQATWAAGYRGGQGELLREARIGNEGISFPSLPFLAFGDGSYRSFGAAALIRSDSFSGRAMIRYDQADQVVKRFVGSTEVVDTPISPNSFIVGKYYITRVTPAANLEVFVQSVSGTISGSDGNAYRQLDPSEFSYAAVTGVVSLAASATTRVLAFYVGSGTDPAADPDPTKSDNVTLAGIGACDLLYVPPPLTSTGTLDPGLQILGRYATTAGAANAEAFVLNPSSGLRDESFLATIDPGGFVEITHADEASPLISPSDYRQPFASASYGGMDWLYTTDFSSATKSGAAPVYTRSIVVRSFSTSSLIAIDKDFVAGSIAVTRNGIPDYSFTVDPQNGTLSLVPPPGPTDEILVSYMKESDERKSGVIAGALGGFWDSGEGSSAWAALGASWAVPGASFASDSLTNAGSVDLTAGEKSAKGDFTHSAAIAARYSQDDATGTYRIEGMESASGYASSFRPTAAPSSYSVQAIAESGLSALFPKIVASLHADGSAQMALEITAAPLASADPASIYAVEGEPPYASFKSFSFSPRCPHMPAWPSHWTTGAPRPRAPALA
jgi:hypothetical protein